MPAVHLVRNNAETISHDATLELRREEAVVATQQEPRRHVGPRIERPWLLERPTSLSPLRMREHLGNDIVRNAVERDHSPLARKCGITCSPH